MGCVLGQHDDSGKKEQVIYYLSNTLVGYETRYTPLENTFMLLGNPEAQTLHAGPLGVKLLARMDPLKYLFEKPAVSRILDGSEYCPSLNLCHSEIHQGTGHRRSLGHAPRPGLRTVEDRLPR